MAREAMVFGFWFLVRYGAVRYGTGCVPVHSSAV